jgi:hypothetical protein
MDAEEKIFWVTDTQLENAFNGPRVIDVLCEVCGDKWEVSLTNGELLDVTNDGCEIYCHHCKTPIILKWEYNKDVYEGLDFDEYPNDI